MTPDATKHLSKVDKILARVIRKVGPVAVPSTPAVSPYMSLVRAVAHQQLTGKAANTILGRFLALYPGGKFPAPDRVLKTPDRRLRSVGFSWAKVAAIKDIAAKTLEGVVPTARAMVRMSDQEIIDRLTTIRGVGRWTVEMMLIFKLKRPDVLPATDYGVRKGIARVYKLKQLPSPKEVVAFGERWRPHCSAAAWYLWRACDLQEEAK